MRRLAVLLAIGAQAPHVRAHLAPLLPSTCRFDTVRVAVPATGAEGLAAPATDADAWRVVYDTTANAAVFCPIDLARPGRCGTPVARTFTLAGATGTLTLPVAISAALSGRGELDAANVPITITLEGVTQTIAVALTTGLAGGAGRLVSGTPLTGDGTITLVGTLDDAALPFPVAGNPLVLDLTCQLAPAPDLDQFTIAPRATPLRGRLGKGRAQLDTTVTFTPFSSTPIVDQPLRALVQIDGTPVSALVSAAGWQGTGRRLSAASDDDRGTVTMQRRRADRLRLRITADALTLPALAPGSTVTVGLSLQVGTTIVRAHGAFAVSRDGQRLRSR